MVNTEVYIIDFIDKKGKRTVFEKENFEKHQKKRPDLRIMKDDGRIEQAKNDPDLIITSQDKKLLCYYKLEYTVNNINKYTKVFIKKTKSKDIIITAYRPDFIKELKYHKPQWQKKGFQP